MRNILGVHREIGEYGCKKCNHYFPEHYLCELDKCIHGEKNICRTVDTAEKYALEALKNIAIRDSRGKKHKCENCPWGTWTGVNYKCALPRCMPKLGDFNGADRR